jgi:Icc-related predicted phosphoesterase
VARPGGVRVAALGDTHMTISTAGRLRGALAGVAGDADLLLLAGDLTNDGRLEEAGLVCAELDGLGLPVLAVLGNHDEDSGEGERIAGMLCGVGVEVLEGTGVVLVVGGVRVGVAGVKGTGGGFDPSATPATVTEGSSGIVHRPASVDRLATALGELDADVRIALTHYAPTSDTVVGEPERLWWNLGSHLLGAAVDAGGAHLAVHGHAHYGTEEGWTAGGCPVRNVARRVIRRPYAVYALSATGSLA